MVNSALAGYTAGSLAFVVLTVLLATRWRGALGPRFPFAAGVTAVWAAMLAWQAAAGPVPAGLIFSLEALRNVAWLYFLVGVIDRSDDRGSARRLRRVTYGAAVAILALGPLGGLFGGIRLPFLEPGVVFVLSIFLFALLGLVLIEQLYRNLVADQRWAMKFLCLGLGGLYAFDLFLYSKGLLFTQIDSTLWSARGAIYLLVAPLLGIAAARNVERRAAVAVSRQMAFYTTSLLGGGLYLLAMAAGGWYIQRFGGTWGGVAQAIFLFGALLLLLVMLFSGQVRARLKVFLSKHFLPYRYDYRDEWLRLTRRLASTDEDVPLRNRAIMAIAGPVESVGGVLWLRDDSGAYVHAAHQSMRVDEGAMEPADGELARFLRERRWVVDVAQSREDPDLYGHLELPEWLAGHPEAWLVVPLVQDEQLLGFVVLARPRAPQRLTWEDLDLLKTVGAQVAGYLALDLAAQELAEARQFQALNRLTAFIMHDLKNLIAQQSLVVRNAAKHKDNPRFVEDAIMTVDNSVKRMSRLLEQLQQGETAGAARRTRLQALCEELVSHCGNRLPRPELQTAGEALEVHIGRERLLMVLGHLVRNAQEATPPDGEVRVRLLRRGDEAVIEVADTGCGMDETFLRERLFRPFDSTKGSKGMGIGVYQAREFARAAGGDLEVRSRPGEGSVFRVRLPLAAATTAEQRRSGVA